MMAKWFRIRATGALCLIVAMFWAVDTALAQDGGGGGGKGYEAGTFWGADLDRDEFISEEEARAPAAKGLHRVFSEVDQDGDGLIGYYEFSDFLRYRSHYMKLAEEARD